MVEINELQRTQNVKSCDMSLLSSFCKDFESKLKLNRKLDELHHIHAHEEIEQRRREIEAKEAAEYERRYKESMGSFTGKLTGRGTPDKRFTEAKEFYDNLRRRVDNEMRKYVQSL